MSHVPGYTIQVHTAIHFILFSHSTMEPAAFQDSPAAVQDFSNICS